MESKRERDAQREHGVTEIRDELAVRGVEQSGVCREESEREVRVRRVVTVHWRRRAENRGGWG